MGTIKSEFGDLAVDVETYQEVRVPVRFGVFFSFSRIYNVAVQGASREAPVD